MAMDVTTYVLGVRFSLDGVTWVEGFRNGTANGTSNPQRARITVSRPAIGWCKLGGELIAPPDSFDLRIGEVGPTIYGQVYMMGVTDRAGPGPGIAGELGIGDAGTSP